MGTCEKCGKTNIHIKEKDIESFSDFFIKRRSIFLNSRGYSLCGSRLHQIFQIFHKTHSLYYETNDLLLIDEVTDCHYIEKFYAHSSWLLDIVNFIFSECKSEYNFMDEWTKNWSCFYQTEAYIKLINIFTEDYSLNFFANSYLKIRDFLTKEEKNLFFHKLLIDSNKNWVEELTRIAPRLNLLNPLGVKYKEERSKIHKLIDAVDSFTISFKPLKNFNQAGEDIEYFKQKIADAVKIPSYYLYPIPNTVTQYQPAQVVDYTPKISWTYPNVRTFDDHGYGNYVVAGTAPNTGGFVTITAGNGAAGGDSGGIVFISPTQSYT